MSNDYLLTTTFKGNASETAKLDAWSFSIDGVQTPAVDTRVCQSWVTSPASGSPWVVSFDNINANDCNGGGGGQEVCLESAGTLSCLVDEHDAQVDGLRQSR